LKNKIKIFLKEKIKLKYPSEYIDNFYHKRKINKDKEIYKDKYSSEDILNKLIKMGLKKGDTLFIHSSWNHFFNYKGKPGELINILLTYLTEEGTLVMPCFPAIQDASKVFNIKRTPSGAGFLTEMFRRYKGTLRSVNLNHSVCAFGKNAEFLTKDHHKSKTSWDEMSPYYRLKEVDALIVGLGVGYNLEVATSLHCVESILRKEIYYYSLLFTDKVEYKYKDISGDIGIHSYLKRRGSIDTKKISKYFSEEELVESKLSNLEIYSIRADLLISRAIKLGRKGITMYTSPKPKNKLFKVIR
jgi:aminoglycoside 3-N-acetyltransferase